MKLIDFQNECVKLTKVRCPIQYQGIKVLYGDLNSLFFIVFYFRVKTILNCMKLFKWGYKFNFLFCLFLEHPSDFLLVSLLSLSY